MATIRELAKLSGFSTATVMRALHEDRHILPETKEKIMRLAALYDYHVNTVQAAIINERLIGCIVPSVTSLIFSPLLKGVLESAFAVSLRVVVLENNSSVTHTCKALHVLHEQGVLGVVIASGHDHRIPASEALALWSDNIHIVTADGNPFVDGVVVDCVETDFEELTSMAIGYLYDLGHRSIAYVGRRFRDDGHPLQREIHIRKAMQKYQLSTEKFYDVIRTPDTNDMIDLILASSNPPTAIITWNDTWAAKLSNILQQRGWDIPKDMSILGVGNESFDSLLSPPLTSVEQNFYEIGKQAMSLLCERITNNLPYPSYDKKRLVIHPHIEKRSSCIRPNLNMHR